MACVKLNAAFGDYEAGEKVEVDDATAEKLVAAGLAEAAEADEGADDDQADEEKAEEHEAEKAVATITGRIEKAVEKKLKSLSKPKGETTRLTVPAKPVDKLAGFRKMGDWLRCMWYERKGDYNAARRMAEFRLVQKAPTGQSESGNSEHDGGDTVPEIWANELWEKIRQNFLLLDHTKKFEASGDTVRIPIINDTSRVTGSRPMRYYAIGEGNSYTSSKITTGQVVLTPYKYGVLGYSTLELLRDSNSNFEQVITDQIAKEIRFALNDLLINGSGSSAPAGLLNQNCKISITKESGQGARTVWLPNLAKMVARLGYGLEEGALFLVNKAVKAQLHQLAFDPAATDKTSAYGLTWNFADPFPLRFAGIPIVELEQCAALGAAGDVILVNPSQVATFVKPIEISVSEHVAFLTDEVVYKGCVRVDCDNLWSAAETPFNGTSGDTTSPVVVIESRGST